MKKYLEDTYLFELETVVLLFESLPDCKHGNAKLELEESIFHPQGGGQPSDVGLIFVKGQSDPAFTVTFSSIEPSNGHLVHYGIASSQISVGTAVRIEVNKETRILNARLHSAGHALDSAMQQLGYPSSVLKPLKGYHFADCPNVEYEIQPGNNLSEEELKTLPERLTAKLAELCDIETVVETLSKEEASQALEGDLEGYPDTVRVVSVAGVKCPCGGTHVRNTTELGIVTVTKLKKKKNNLKISYSLS